MIDGLRPYPAMKDSTVPWLGHIPEAWETMPLKRWVKMNAFSLPETTAPDYEFLYLDIGSVGTGVLAQKPTRLRFKESPSRARRVVREGDTIVSTVRTYLKAVYFFAHEADNIICSTGFAVLTPGPGAIPKFVSYWVQSNPFTDRVTAESVGIAYPAIAETRLGTFRVPVPSLSEQMAIVRFLDHWEAQIRRYIRAKQKLIKLLEEQKQVTIQRLVTDGFQERLPFDVLGRPREVRNNKNWLCVTVGHLIQRGWLKIQDGNHGALHPKADDYVDDGIPFLMANDIRSSGLNLEHCAKISEGQARGLRIGFSKPRDVLLTHKATIGQVGIVPDELPWPFLMLTPQVTYYRCKPSALEPLYLFAYMQTAQFQQQIAILSSNQSTRNYIGILEQKNLVIPIPDLETQVGIVREFQAATKTFDSAAGRARQEIGFLREYRSRLTTDVVTGKLDVRDAAAQLPQETLGVEPLEESDDLAQDESTAEDMELEATDTA